MRLREEGAPIAERLKRLRSSRHLTQRELAARAGVSIAAISTIERGRKSPRIGTAALLADVLEVETNALFRPLTRRRVRSAR